MNIKFKLYLGGEHIGWEWHSPNLDTGKIETFHMEKKNNDAWRNVKYLGGYIDHDAKTLEVYDVRKNVS